MDKPKLDTDKPESDIYDIVVLLPARNEELTIRESILRFSVSLPEAHIVVIDNNSSDLTLKVAQEVIDTASLNARVIKECKPGKGNAIFAGFSAVNAFVYLMCDSDCTYPIEDAKRMIGPIVEGRADLVTGDRLSNGAYDEQNSRRFHTIGNILLTSLVNTFFLSSYSDVTSGFKAFSNRFVASYKSPAPGFDLEVDLVMHAAINSFTTVDIPISYGHRPDGSFSKLNTFSDGFSSIKKILAKYLGYKWSKISG